jgi:Ca2+-binding EF-hand superfamily protein
MYSGGTHRSHNSSVLKARCPDFDDIPSSHICKWMLPSCSAFSHALALLTISNSCFLLGSLFFHITWILFVLHGDFIWRFAHLLVSPYFAVHTREKIKQQIKAGKTLRGDDDIIRRSFLKYSQQSTEEERFAHIRRDSIIPALHQVGVDIVQDELDDVFQKYDQNGDGVLDLEEFRQVCLSPSQLPSRKKTQEVFAMYAVKSEQGAPDHIPVKSWSDALLKDLGLKRANAKCVYDYFMKAVSSSEMITFDEFYQAILSTSKDVDEQGITRVFEEYAVPGKYRFIPSNKLRSALEELGVLVTKDQLGNFSRIIELSFKGRIDIHAFKHVALYPTSLVAWAESLPIATLLADALPKHSRCDHLRVISTLTQNEISCITEEFCLILEDILQAHVGRLKASFWSMDKEAEKPTNQSVDRYEVIKMKAGGIKDFYQGLDARIGELM